MEDYHEKDNRLSFGACNGAEPDHGARCSRRFRWDLVGLIDYETINEVMAAPKAAEIGAAMTDPETDNQPSPALRLWL